MKNATSNNSGFTLLEILTVLVITGILISIAAPSFISQKRELRQAVISIETLLRTVNLTARANSGNPYRVSVASDNITYPNRPPTTFLKVEYLQNGTCADVNGNAQNQGWQEDVRKRVELPDSITISNFPAIASPNNGLCFNGRGEVFRGGQNFTVNVATNQQFNNAVSAVINVSTVGDVSHVAKNRAGGTIPPKVDINGNVTPNSDLN
jgi:prepilin-type N-terminal cleavage/methylation domain-containing protein